jgi:glycopeptide antibiotics resistance protein
VLIGTGVRFSGGIAALWIAPAVLGVVALLVTYRARRDTRRTVDLAVDVLVVAYAIGVIAITLYPFSFDIEPGRILDRGNWVPFGGTLGFLTSNNSLQNEIGSRDFLANITLFAPIGLLLGSRVQRRSAAVFVAILLVLMAFALEVVQGLTVAARTLDIDDAIAGSLGAVAAALLGAMLPRAATTRRRPRYALD